MAHPPESPFIQDKIARERRISPAGIRKEVRRMSDWPYSIRDVLGLMNISYSPSGNEIRVKCPICNMQKEERTMGINLSNETFNCFRCMSKGRFGQQLYAQAYGISSLEAHREICEKLNIPLMQPKRERRAAPVRASVTPAPEQETHLAASPEARDRAYRVMLEQLTLSQEHRDDLFSRGLTDEEIDELGYKTMPVPDEKGSNFFELIVQMDRKGVKLDGIPGFYRTSKKGLWFLKSKHTGITVPYRDILGRMTGIQVRLNDEDIPEDGNKYLWLSSNNLKDGTKATGMVHYACEFTKDENGRPCPLPLTAKSGKKYLCITEGAMKGDIAHTITKWPFVCLPGVGIQKDLEKDIPRWKELGVTNINLMFDMDQVTNINVLRALERLQDTLKAAGFEVSNGSIWGCNFLDGKGRKCKIDLDRDFVFTKETLEQAITDGKLENILSDLKEMGRTMILYSAHKDGFTASDKSNYSTLLKKAKEMGFAGCKYANWELRYKGIDDYQAAEHRGVQYVI